MKTLLTIIFFLPLLGNAQGFLGASKKEVKDYLTRLEITPKDTTIQKKNVLQYQYNGSNLNLYLFNDTVHYYTVFSPLSEINNTIGSFASQKFQREEKYKWIDYSHPVFEVIYEIKKYTKGFLTIVSK